MQKLIILDFSTGECKITTVQEEPKDWEEYIESLGYSIKNVQWMVTSEPIIVD